MTFDLAAKMVVYSLQTESKYPPVVYKQTLTIGDGRSFDENTKFYLCSSKLGASPNACTISEFLLEYRAYGAYSGGAEVGHFAGKYSIIVFSFLFFYFSISFSRSLLSTHRRFIKKLHRFRNPSSFWIFWYRYFISGSYKLIKGDHPTNPTPGTSPTWDSSVTFISLSSHIPIKLELVCHDHKWTVYDFPNPFLSTWPGLNVLFFLFCCLGEDSRCYNNNWC